jgi:very-short-patch-repair endonuclease
LYQKQRHHRHNVEAARDLRDRQTIAEVRLWEALRARRLEGIKFRRQHPIGQYVVDFCCPERHLIVELDGGVHDTQREQDEAREGVLITAGYRVLRFPNEAVLNELPSVLATIRSVAAEQRVYPTKTPRAGST